MFRPVFLYVLLAMFFAMATIVFAGECCRLVYPFQMTLVYASTSLVFLFCSMNRVFRSCALDDLSGHSEATITIFNVHEFINQEARKKLKILDVLSCLSIVLAIAARWYATHS